MYYDKFVVSGKVRYFHKVSSLLANCRHDGTGANHTIVFVVLVLLEEVEKSK